MKILHILDHSVPLHSGYTFRSENIFIAQKKMGFTPVVLTSSKHEESLKKETPSKEEINGFTYYRTGQKKSIGIPIIPELALMHKLYKRILQVCKIEKPDIIHAHSPVLNGIPAIRAARKLKIPVIYEIRAFWEDAAVDHGTYKEGSWKYNLTKSIETWVCRKADHICILCNGLKNDLITRGIPADKITPVFNGINPENLKPTLPDQEFLSAWDLEGKTVIGFIGSFYRYEGLDLLIKAFAKVTEKFPETKLLLVGGGEMLSELTDLVADNLLENKVVMPGRIDNNKIDSIYAMIDILVYPRYSMRLTNLVTPLKPLEAMAMEKALIASDVGGHQELIKHGKTGLLFPVRDESALADGLQKMIKDRELRETLQSNGLKWIIENHTWEKTTSVYSKIYKEVQSKIKYN